MKAKYEATIKLTAINNPKEEFDKNIKEVLEDEIGEKVDIDIDSKFSIEE